MIELIAALPLPRPSRFQHPRLGPYLLLCEALLVDVFRTRDAYRRYLAQGRSLRRLKQQYEQDWQWVTSEEDAAYALSFPHVCELLGLDPTAVRKAFLNSRHTKFPRKSWGIRKVITVLDESKGSSSGQEGMENGDAGLSEGWPKGKRKYGAEKKARELPLSAQPKGRNASWDTRERNNVYRCDV